MLKRPPSRMSLLSAKSAPVPLPMFVAMAAPSSPSFGNGPSPKIKQGPSRMLIQFASHNVRIAIAASPAPRKIALIMKSITTVTFPASITRVNAEPCSTTHGEPPISWSSFGASGAPMTPMTIETISARAIAWTAARAAPSGFCSPIRRATIAIAPMLKPIARA